MAFLSRPPGQGTPGANSASDHMTVLDLAPTSPNHPFPVGAAVRLSLGDQGQERATDLITRHSEAWLRRPARKRQRRPAKNATSAKIAIANSTGWMITPPAIAMMRSTMPTISSMGGVYPVGAIRNL
jgi:hypothetical protein